MRIADWLNVYVSGRDASWLYCDRCEEPLTAIERSDTLAGLIDRVSEHKCAADVDPGGSR